MIKGINIIPKIQVKDEQTLAVIYTPGVAAASEKIAENKDLSFDYTNRENTVGVFAYDYSKALKRAIFLKSALGIDAVPFQINSDSPDDIKSVIENLEPSFGAADLSLISEAAEKTDFSVSIPVLKGKTDNLKEFFLCVSKNIFPFDMNKLEGTCGEKSLFVRKLAGGSVETELTEKEHVKPVGIITEGSAVLGLGNIGAYAALPVMEGKAVLFYSLAGLSALPVCIKTQKTDEFVKIVSLIKNSFSAINLEDIAAPNCFETEKKLSEILDIPVFHDDAHGTSVVVLAGLINALKVVNKNIEDVKIVMSGAGAAGFTVANILIDYGAKNIVVCDRNGAINKDEVYTKPNHIALSKTTNPYNEKGSLKEIIKNADVFIGVSAPNLLNEEDIKKMNNNAVVFALANPVPEIMPDVAERAGAKVAASGRSDFKNQINNCLVFPGIFKGFLKFKIKKVTSEIKINCAKALAGVITADRLSKDCIIPKALDKTAAETVAESVGLNRTEN